MSKHPDIKKIIRWCSYHRGKDFHFHEVGVSSHALGSLCDTTFHGKIWLVRKGKTATRDTNNGLMRYGLASWVDLDNLHERYTI